MSQESAQSDALDSGVPADTMTDEQLAEAKRYGRHQLICMLADKAIDVTFLAVMAFLIARPLDSWLEQWAFLSGSRSSLRLLVLLGITFCLHVCVSFPLSFYSDHWLEHKFALSRQSLRGWLRRYAKRNALAIAFNLVIFLGLYWIIWLTGAWWWLAAAVAFFGVSILLGQLAPVLILPLFYKIEKLEEPELTERLERLAGGTGLSIEGVYRMGLSEETAKANAMLAGLGRTRRVLMGDTLLNDFTADEIEVIFAHEIGHHVHHHIRTMIVMGVVYSLIGFWICHRLLLWYAGVAQPELLPTFTLPFLMFSLTVFGLLLEPLQNVLSRHNERTSDRYALERTQLKAAYQSAFRKLAKLNKDDPDPNPVAVFLFHSHPPISERLALAEQAG